MRKDVVYLYFKQLLFFVGAQSLPLPISDYEFLSEKEIDEIDWDAQTIDQPYGYLVECDVRICAFVIETLKLLTFSFCSSPTPRRCTGRTHTTRWQQRNVSSHTQTCLRILANLLRATKERRLSHKKN